MNKADKTYRQKQAKIRQIKNTYRPENREKCITKQKFLYEKRQG